jgi:hypothetical protein
MTDWNNPYSNGTGDDTGGKDVGLSEQDRELTERLREAERAAQTDSEFFDWQYLAPEQRQRSNHE